MLLATNCTSLYVTLYLLTSPYPIHSLDCPNLMLSIWVALNLKKLLKVIKNYFSLNIFVYVKFKIFAFDSVVERKSHILINDEKHAKHVICFCKISVIDIAIIESP